jgi:hypothetical protein
LFIKLPNWRSSVMCSLLSKAQKLDEGQKTKSPHAPENENQPNRKAIFKTRKRKKLYT